MLRWCRPRILIAENDKDFAFTLQDLLQRDGYRAYVAATPEDVHLFVRRFSFLAAIIDVRLRDETDTDWSGLVEARVLPCPVIILSAYDSEEDIHNAFQVGPGIPTPIAFISKNDAQWYPKVKNQLERLVNSRLTSTSLLARLLRLFC